MLCMRNKFVYTKYVICQLVSARPHKHYGPTDGPTNGPTNKAAYRVACTQLKTKKSHFQHGLLGLNICTYLDIFQQFYYSCKFNLGNKPGRVKMRLNHQAVTRIEELSYSKQSLEIQSSILHIHTNEYSESFLNKHHDRS